jgi:hypothetical protein
MKLVICCITRPMPVPVLPSGAMPGDLERLPVLVSAVAVGAGPAAVTGELLGWVRAQLPVVGELGSGSRRWCRRGDPGCDRRAPAAPTQGEVAATSASGSVRPQASSRSAATRRLPRWRSGPVTGHGGGPPPRSSR